MHILIIPSEHFVTESEPLGGVFQLHQAKAISKHNFHVGVISVGFISFRYLFKKYYFKKREIIDNIKIFRRYKKLYFPFRYIHFKILKAMIIKMADKEFQNYIIKYGSPNVIHAHNCMYAGFVAEYLKKKYGINYIITEHSSSFYSANFSKKELSAIQLIAENASVFTAVSSRFKDILRRYIQTEINLLPNVVDSNFFMSDLPPKKNNQFIFLNAASLDTNKNHELLLRSFEKLAKSNNNMFLHIAGDGPSKEYLKDLTKKICLEKQVKFLGRITAHDLREEMLRSDCFVLSSNYETFGVVLIEALACGLPLVATKSGGPVDIVNEQNGLLVDIKSQDQLHDAMAFVFLNHEKYDKVTLRNQAKTMFGEDAFMHNALKYYKQAIYYGK